MEAGLVSAPLGPSVCLCLPTVCSAQAGLVESSFDRALVGPDDAIVASERVVHKSFVPVGRQTAKTYAGVELAGPATCAEVPSRPRDLLASRMEVIQHHAQKAGFSKAVVQVTVAELRHSTAALYQSKWSRFLGWCDRQGVFPCKASVPQIAEVFLYLRQELCLSVPAVKGCQAAQNHVFSLTGMDLAASTVVSRMFHSFERSCSPQEMWPPDWNLSLVLLCLSQPPFEPLKLASVKHLTWKTSFLLALASAKRVSELHSLFFRVRHSCGWNSYSLSFLPDFVAKTQNPSVPDTHFVEFSVRPLTSLVVAVGVNICSAPSEPFVSTCPGRSSIVLASKVCSSRRNRCPTTPFISGCAQ